MRHNLHHAAAILVQLPRGNMKRWREISALGEVGRGIQSPVNRVRQQKMFRWFTFESESKPAPAVLSSRGGMPIARAERVDDRGTNERFCLYLILHKRWIESSVQSLTTPTMVIFCDLTFC